MKKRLSESSRYLLFGAAFGLMFPLLSIIAVWLFDISITVLLGIISTAPVFLGLFARFAGVRQDRINEVNRRLEETVTARTRSIRNLLDVSGEGYLSFGSDFVVKNDYSQACVAIFGMEIGGYAVDSLLFEEENKRQEFRQGLGLFFSGKSRGDVIFDLLDSEIQIRGRILELGFKVIDQEEVLCAVKDVSDQRALVEERSRDTMEQQIVVHVVSHKKYFSAFTREASELFDRIDGLSSENTSEQMTALQRALHTFKGNASFFRFDGTKMVAHDLEFLIADSLMLDEELDPTYAVMTLKTAYYAELEIVERRLGTSWMGESEMVSVPIHKYRGIERYVHTAYPGDFKLNAALRSFRMVSMESLFVRFPDMAERLAEQIGRRIMPLEVSGGRFPVLPERYDALVGSFVHIIRNMLDHGIEPPAERELKNKKPEGRLVISMESSDDTVVIEFKDDGRGLSVGEIEKKARAAGLISPGEKPSRAVLYSMIFHHEFSTADEVTDVSGRGYGLSAVKEEVDHMGGKLSLSTVPDRGTTIRITIPERRKKKRSL